MVSPIYPYSTISQKPSTNSVLNDFSTSSSDHLTSPSFLSPLQQNQLNNSGRSRGESMSTITEGELDEDEKSDLSIGGKHSSCYSDGILWKPCFVPFPPIRSPLVNENSFSSQNSHHNNHTDGRGGDSDFVEIVSVCCGWSHSLALVKSGEVFSFGDGGGGRLGHGSQCDELIPRQVESMQVPTRQISAGQEFSMFLSKKGGVYGTGGNLEEEGGENKSFAPQSLNDLILRSERYKIEEIRKISTGLSSTYLLTKNDHLYILFDNKRLKNLDQVGTVSEMDGGLSNHLMLFLPNNQISEEEDETNIL